MNGGTRTSAALQQTTVTLYDAASGARQDATKVAILITDGFSEPPQPVPETLKVGVVVVVVVGCSSRAKTTGEALTTPSPTACFPFFSSPLCFFKWKSACAHQFHSSNGSAKWGDCGQAFPDELRVSLFPWDGVTVDKRSLTSYV